jgi:phosphopantothenate-cysteine ligase
MVYTIIMNVLITAGGNTEKIDDVRAIRNTGTGRLGSLVAGKLAAAGARIFYVCDRRAVIPQAQGIEVMGADNMDARTQGVEIINADDVTELEAAVRTACTEHRIDAVVHSMAVSDYRVKNVTTSKDAACSVAAAISEGESGLRVAGASHRGDAVESYTAQQAAFTAGMISRAITAAAPVNGKGKISSDNEDLLVVLERAPKIISMLRPLAPDAVIVGFKLL